MTTPATAPATQRAEHAAERRPLRNGPRAKPRDSRTFADALKFVTARPEEMKWASIPWQTDLWEARRLAAVQDKPIFMWSMNGNPLGCV
jgi:hypothetical protein